MTSPDPFPMPPETRLFRGQEESGIERPSCRTRVSLSPVSLPNPPSCKTPAAQTEEGFPQTPQGNGRWKELLLIQLQTWS